MPRTIIPAMVDNTPESLASRLVEKIEPLEGIALILPLRVKYVMNGLVAAYDPLSLHKHEWKNQEVWRRWFTKIVPGAGQPRPAGQNPALQLSPFMQGY